MNKKIVTVTLHFDPSDVEITQTLYGLRLSLKDGSVPTQPGTPAIPFRVIEVALPNGFESTHVTVEEGPAAPLTSVRTYVAPVFEEVIDAPDGDTRVASRMRWTPPNRELYQEALEDRDAPSVSIAGVRIEGGLQIATVKAFPIRYTKAHSLELITKMAITLHARPMEALHPRVLFARVNPMQAARKRVDLARSVVNPDLFRSAAGSAPQDMKSLRKLLNIKQSSSINSIMANPPGGSTGIKTPASPAVRIPRYVDYLIITDNHFWDAGAIKPGKYAGDMQGSFKKLADWKKGRGLRTHIATIQNIVSGTYGDFTTGARDLQEVIRFFLKDFIWRHRTDWVLLGGGVDIVPARNACGSRKWGFIPLKQQVKVNCATWMGDFLGVYVDQGFGLADSDMLTMAGTGRIIERWSPGSKIHPFPPYWYHTTDATFTTRSPTETEFIRVEGDEAEIKGSVQCFMYKNMIPTDLYYSSLFSPLYNQPGRHDWDFLSNGLYGQITDAQDSETVDLGEDVNIGRAPVLTPAEADTFVAKVIAYESVGDRPAMHDYLDKVLLVAEHFGDVYKEGNIFRAKGDPKLPPEKQYSHDANGARTLIHAPVATWGYGFDLVCYTTEKDAVVLPYNPAAGTGSRGWYFTLSPADMAPFEFAVFEDGEVVRYVPVPTTLLVVHSSNSAELTPHHYVIEENGMDGSMDAQEALRKQIRKEKGDQIRIERLYTDETDLSPADLAADPLQHLTPTALQSAVSGGPYVLSMSGHGWYGGCCQFGVNILTASPSDGRYLLIYADSCFTNEFNKDKAISRQSLIIADKGAVSYFGSSRSSWQGIGKEFLLAYFHLLHGNVFRHLAQLSYARLKVANLHPGEAVYRWNALSLNLMGDPEMPVFRDSRDARTRFIGNMTSKEVHERFCPWVELMWVGNVVRFEDLDAALEQGFDGCSFCLHEHHAR